jgi:DNA topoisomerase-1
VRAIEHVAERLGNTPSICRKCYIHPAVLEAYLDGSLVETLQQRAEDLRERAADLDDDEASVLSFLQRKLAAA